MNAEIHGETILSVLLGAEIFSLIKRTIQHGGRTTSKESHHAVHHCIRCNEFVILSSLINDAGFVPTVLRSHSRFCPHIKSVYFERYMGILSPFFVALLTGHPKLAQCMYNHMYLKLSDLTILPKSDLPVFMLDPDLAESKEILDALKTSPPPLMTLSFVHVSDLLGADGDRRQKVQQLGLPRRLQEALAFIPGTLGRIETDEPMEYPLLRHLPYESDSDGSE